MSTLIDSFSLYLQCGSWLAYIVSFFAGILVSFTPCVYPLIPINVAFIASKAPPSRLKAFYLSLSFVIGTAVVYSILGTKQGVIYLKKLLLWLKKFINTKFQR
jgi:thiol:disulfide interchange protein DsbD